MITVELKGKKYPAYITMGAARRFKQQSGHDMSEMTGTLDEATIYLFCVLQSACKREGKEFPYDNIDDFADDLSIDEFTAWSEQFAKAQEASGGSDKAATIEDTLALAVTRIGLSPTEFDALTLDEWSAIAMATTDIEESRERLNLERTRLLYYAVMSPYLKEGVTPLQLLPFPWDSEKMDDTSEKTEVTSEDIKRMTERWCNE